MKFENPNGMKLASLFVCFMLAICTCKYCYANSDDEIEKKEQEIERMLDGVKYAASPKISIKYCKQILEIDPQNAEAYYKLAEAYRDMADFVVKSEEEREHYKLLSLKSFEIAKELGYQDNLKKNQNK